MRHIAFALALACAAGLTGCSSLVSLNPIVTEGHAEMDPALLGMWSNPDGKEGYWIRADGNGYRIAGIQDSSDTLKLTAHLMVVGDAKLVDIVSGNDDAFQLAVHNPARVWTEGGTLRIAYLDSEWIKEQATRQLPTAPTKDRQLITAPGEAVAAFFTKYGADSKAYGKPETLYRVQ
jgi:hypothetical protein